MGYARWALARSGSELRVRVEADVPLSEAAVIDLFRDLRLHLDDEAVTEVLFDSGTGWLAVHRHEDGPLHRGWHVRSQVSASLHRGVGLPERRGDGSVPDSSPSGAPIHRGATFPP